MKADIHKDQNEKKHYIMRSKINYTRTKMKTKQKCRDQISPFLLFICDFRFLTLALSLPTLSLFLRSSVTLTLSPFVFISLSLLLEWETESCRERERAWREEGRRKGKKNRVPTLQKWNYVIWEKLWFFPCQNYRLSPTF